MKPFIKLGLLLVLCCLIAFGQGKDQGKGKGKKPPPEPTIMASRFCDSFARAVDSADGSKYPWALILPSITTPTRGEKTFDAVNSGSIESFDYGISTAAGNSNYNITDVRLSFYLYTDATPDGSDTIVTIINSNNDPKATLYWDSGTRKLTFDPGANVGSTVLALDTWYRVDLKVGTGASAAWEVRVHEDGSPGTSLEMSGTADLTTLTTASVRFTGNPIYDHFVSHVHLDDSSYIADGNDYRIETLFPDGNGNYTAWTGDSTDVDDIKHDATATEIQTSTNLDRETVTLQNLSLAAGESILSVMNVYHMRKTSNAVVNVQVIDRVGTTDRDSASFELQKNDGGDDDQKWFVIYDTKPGGGSFSESDINGYEIGLEHNQSQARDIFCTAMNCNVLIEMPAPSSAGNIYPHFQNLGVY